MVKNQKATALALLGVAAVSLLWAHPALAASGTDPVDIGFFDQMVRNYANASKAWAAIMTNAATWLFFALATISMAVTFGFMAVKNADSGEVLGEFVKFFITTGFYYWLLLNGAKFGNDIIFSLAKLGARGAGVSVPDQSIGLSPSGVVDIGFKVFDQVVDNMSLWPDEIATSLVGALLGIFILLVLVIIAINMLVLIISSWIIGYAGIFFLGFGGSRWTSDMAINYYKTMLGLGAQIMAMMLLVGIGQTFIEAYFQSVQANVGASDLKALGALAGCVLGLLILTSTIPGMLAGIITGSSAGGGLGNAVGMGTLAAAGGLAVAGAAVAGSAVAGAAANASGGMQALMAAYQGAQENVSAGTDIASRLAGGMGGGSSSESGAQSGPAPAGSSPMGSAMGIGQGSSGGTGSQDAKGSGGLAGKLQQAGRVAADMGAQLAGGAARMAQEKAAGIAEKAQERIDQSALGQFADEVKNPGAKAQERADNAVLQQADKVFSAQERTEAVGRAQDMLQGLNKEQAEEVASFAGNSLGKAANNAGENS